jgi:phospholipid/cholesterol/gamma-HCH transport system substrate-binding protein
MKFKIRHADKIVGILALIALVFLILTIFFLGSKQRWFSAKHSFYTILDTASGVNENMSIVYKGFAIGSVGTIELINDPMLAENDKVKVSFTIFEEYIDRVKYGSLVNVNISPIGLGNQFLFYPGLGEPLEENAMIPLISSTEGQRLILENQSQVSEGEDNLSALFTQANDFLQNVNAVLQDAGDAIAGTDATALGRIIGGVEETITSVSDLASNVDVELSPILHEIQSTVSSLNTAISSLNEKLNDPDGLLSSLLAADGVMFNDLENSLQSLSTTLNNIEKISGTQASGLIEELRVTISSAEDVLESLKNNPLLKKGFTEDVNAESGGNSPRDISF